MDDKVRVREELDLTGARWQATGGELEFAHVEHTDGLVYTALRKATDPDGTVLVFTPSEWDAFVAGARDGEFHDLAGLTAD
ncbi:MULTISPECIES: DUF397 domain-containing protein [Amycolatopsis]|uniref:DUF397 domain-containing protein n=1 Tax=Amycolatopsis thermalba TaxID=944492 RepID=A0ABY4NSW5_9PSEU|nr:MULTISPECIES: DUF397 domain-containing protein [Amycolatopsis]OXM66644.1 DUF397 domain-containing protein [Amycolatopsis sp. KNN50.9b]UQS23155.1 DUF397 domain-containing protein [Amycolatopsis thermalba]